LTLPAPARARDGNRHRIPSRSQIRRFLGKALSIAGAKPKYIVCDKGTKFWSKGFKRSCERRNIKPRFGAVGQHGSLAVVERLIRTMKGLLRCRLIPLRDSAMPRELALLAEWYNRHRPHTDLGGRTPEERYRRIPSACRRPRFEPRERWPITSGCARPPAKVRGKPGARLELILAHHQGRKHLPIVMLKKVA
jgi:transposase InsO family protein